MAGGKVEQVALAGIACAVPANVRNLQDEAAVFGEDHMEQFYRRFGVRQRHEAPEGMCTSDLCVHAANRLLDQLDWDHDSIDLLLFVSITADYITPTTSCILQDRLGLPKSCATMDITHPCSGFVYGLWTAANLLSTGNLRRALVMVGDTVSRMVSRFDRSGPLAGDGASVSAVEWDPNAAPMAFEMGSDGGGAKFLYRKAGGFRYPSTEDTRKRIEREDGTLRSDEDLFMDGAEIFAFALREVPPLTQKVLEEAGWTLGEVDHVVMHQANLFMLRQVARKIGIPKEKQVECMEDFGNVGGASIAFAMTEKLKTALRQGPRRLLLLGFGTGLSWGGVALTCGPLVIPDMTLVTADDVCA
jgi:3-oxoacyl-[acyl-carrier-protein] synthase-3